MKAGAISEAVAGRGGIEGLEIGGLQVLDRQRADAGAEMFSQQLRVARPGLVTDVVVGPIAQPSLDEIADSLGTWIDMRARGDAGEDLCCLCLRVGFRAP